MVQEKSGREAMEKQTITAQKMEKDFCIANSVLLSQRYSIKCQDRGWGCSLEHQSNASLISEA